MTTILRQEKFESVSLKRTKSERRECPDSNYLMLCMWGNRRVAVMDKELELKLELLEVLTEADYRTIQGDMERPEATEEMPLAA